MISGKLSARTEQQLVSQCLTHHHNTPCNWHTMQDTFTNWSFFLCPLSPYQFWLFLNCGDINQTGQSEVFWAPKYLNESTIKFTEKYLSALLSFHSSACRSSFPRSFISVLFLLFAPNAFSCLPLPFSLKHAAPPEELTLKLIPLINIFSAFFSWWWMTYKNSAYAWQN